MAKRSRMSRKGSKKLFTRTASRTHRKNMVRGVKRGGIRL